MAEPITKETYPTIAMAFIERLPKLERLSLPVITEDSENFAAWRQYFERHLGWTPYVLKLVLMRHTKGMTVPAKWPNWFDPDFVENPQWQPVRERVTPKHMRETLEQLRRRYGPNWGLQGMPKSQHRTHGPASWHGWADQPPATESVQISDELANLLAQRRAAE